ncbi:MAG: hypothetical protein JWP88_1775 [Flaviaesturariibacter sp.]|nr:hypothetical protein [Flaviaesturariibacter sp.]
MKKIFLFAAIALATTSYAQKVNGKLSFQKGQKLEVVTQTKKESSQEVMGQSVESTANITMTEVYDVQDAGGNGDTIEHKVKRLMFTGEGMGQSQTFDSEKEADRKGEMGQLLDKKLLKNKYTLMLDGSGKVSGVKADDDNPQGKKGEEDAMAAMMSQQLGLSMAMPKTGDNSFFKILPDKEVGVGETWTETTSVDGAKVTKNYKVTGITDGEIMVDFTADSKMEKTMQLMGTDATITATDKAIGKISLDRKTGVMKQMTGSSKTEGTVEVQGMTIPITATTTTTTTVKGM